jgi:hypothetical protein
MVESWQIVFAVPWNQEITMRIHIRPRSVQIFGFVLVSVLLSAVAPCLAATWTVEQDGSGDFTVIQDAVDAAASGDTIAIGPGRYDDFEEHWGAVWTLAAVLDKSLTFVGAGADQTILGPENYGDIDDTAVVCIAVRAEGGVTRVRSLTFENVQLRGLTVSYSGRLEVDNCVFRNSDSGIFAEMGDGGWIRNCQFVDLFNSLNGHGINLYEPSVGVMIEQCTFERCAKGVGAYWSGCTDITVRDCQVSDGVVGVGFASGASGSVIDCTVQGMVNWGVIASGGSSLIAEGNVIDQTGSSGWGYGIYSGSSHYLRNNVIMGTTGLIGLQCPSCDVDIRDNVFLRTGPEAWYIRPSNTPYSGDMVHVDFTHNSWGTDDPAEVAAWIYDYNDNPDYHFIVDYLPMNGVVATEAHSWSLIKSLFDGDGDGEE